MSRLVGRRVDATLFKEQAIKNSWERLSDTEFGKVLSVNDKDYGARVVLSAPRRNASISALDFFKVKEIKPRRLIKVVDPRRSLPSEIYEMFIGEIEKVAAASAQKSSGLSKG